MAKRLTGLNVLGETRRALRILRRVERWLIQERRDEARRGKKKRDDLAARQRARALDDGLPPL